MPGVEVLPTSTAIRAPGWALVPDTGHAPSQVASQATTKRGRAARASNIGGGDTTARQQNAVLKHLADLDRDSHRDVQITVPKDTAGRGMLSDRCDMLRYSYAENRYRVKENYNQCSADINVTKDIRKSFGRRRGCPCPAAAHRNLYYPTCSTSKVCRVYTKSEECLIIGSRFRFVSTGHRCYGWNSICSYQRSFR